MIEWFVFLAFHHFLLASYPYLPPPIVRIKRREEKIKQKQNLQKMTATYEQTYRENIYKQFGLDIDRHDRWANFQNTSDNFGLSDRLQTPSLVITIHSESPSAECVSL